MKCNARNVHKMLTLDQVMEGIHIVQVCTFDQLSKVVLSLEEFLKERARVGVVVIDGIDFPMFTQPKSSFSSRVKALFALGQVLISLMTKYRTAVVITNCMTTRYAKGRGEQLKGKSGASMVEGSEYFVPYLGEFWNYVPNQVLQFTCNPKEKARKAELVKSAFTRLGTVNYRIVHDGFRD